MANPTELGGRELALSLWPRCLPSSDGAVGERFEGIERSSCERAKKSSSPSYGDDDAFIYGIDSQTDSTRYTHRVQIDNRDER